jgi:hypothetical protein
VSGSCSVPARKQLFNILVYDRWDPSLDYFLGFMLCQYMFKVEIVYIYTSKEKFL